MSFSDKVTNCAVVFLCSIALYNIFFKNVLLEKNIAISAANEVELKDLDSILDNKGRVKEFGWSRKHLPKLKLASTHPVILGWNWLQFIKSKRFNYFWFIFENKLIQLGIGSTFLVDTFFLNIYDFENKSFEKESVSLKSPSINDKRSKKLLGDNPALCSNRNYSIDDKLKVTTKMEGSLCKIAVDIKMKSGRFMEAISTFDQNEDNVFDLTPLSENGDYFFYGSKFNNGKCSGKIGLKDEDVKFAKDCIAGADLGIGIMPHRIAWKWSSFSGFSKDSLPISLNIGEGTSQKIAKSNEDFFKIGNKVVRLNPVVLKFEERNLFNGLSLQTHHSFDFSKNYIEATVQIYHEDLKSENFFLFSSWIKYAYGRATGFVKDEEGMITHFDELIGVFEQAHFRW